MLKKAIVVLFAIALVLHAMPMMANASTNEDIYEEVQEQNTEIQDIEISSTETTEKAYEAATEYLTVPTYDNNIEVQTDAPYHTDVVDDNDEVEYQNIIAIQTDVAYQNAVESGRLYLSIMAMSRYALIRQLVFEGFTQSQAEHAANVLDGEVNWYQMAVDSGQTYLELFPMSRNELIDQLVFDGFTQSQAEHAARVLFDNYVPATEASTTAPTVAPTQPGITATPTQPAAMTPPTGGGILPQTGAAMSTALAGAGASFIISGIAVVLKNKKK